jgi:hypothetical protein
MLTKEQLLHFLVGLAEVGNISIVEDDDVLNEDICNSSDRDKIRHMARLVDLLLDTFDYSTSPEFENRLSAKAKPSKK